MPEPRARLLRSLETRDLPAGIGMLAGAILSGSRPGGCACFEDSIAGFADAVLAGGEQDACWHSLRAHLLLCDACTALLVETVDLLEVQLTAGGPAGDWGRPDTWFLEISRSTTSG